MVLQVVRNGSRKYFSIPVHILDSGGNTSTLLEDGGNTSQMAGAHLETGARISRQHSSGRSITIEADTGFMSQETLAHTCTHTPALAPPVPGQMPVTPRSDTSTPNGSVERDTGDVCVCVLTLLT